MTFTASSDRADAVEAAPVNQPTGLYESALLARSPQPAPSGCGGVGEGWAGGPIP